MLAPLRAVFGEAYVQPTPQPGSFPLLGLETKRIALLDEWEFDNAVIAFSTQLLWFEGETFPITRPQNNKQDIGHLLYQGKAPLFITCKWSKLGPIAERAKAAAASGHPSQDTMMLRRLGLYWLSQPLTIPPGVAIPECPHCFGQMLAHYTS